MSCHAGMSASLFSRSTTRFFPLSSIMFAADVTPFMPPPITTTRGLAWSSATGAASTTDAMMPNMSVPCSLQIARDKREGKNSKCSKNKKNSLTSCCVCLRLLTTKSSSK